VAGHEAIIKRWRYVTAFALPRETWQRAWPASLYWTFCHRIWCKRYSKEFRDKHWSYKVNIGFAVQLSRPQDLLITAINSAKFYLHSYVCDTATVTCAKWRAKILLSRSKSCYRKLVPKQQMVTVTSHLTPDQVCKDKCDAEGLQAHHTGHVLLCLGLSLDQD